MSVEKTFTITNEMKGGFPIIIGGKEILSKEDVRDIVRDYTTYKIGLKGSAGNITSTLVKLYDAIKEARRSACEMVYCLVNGQLFELYELFLEDNKARIESINKLTTHAANLQFEITNCNAFVSGLKRGGKRRAKGLDKDARKSMFEHIKSYVELTAAMYKSVLLDLQTCNMAAMSSVLWFIYAYQVIDGANADSRLIKYYRPKDGTKESKKKKHKGEKVEEPKNEKETASPTEESLADQDDDDWEEEEGIEHTDDMMDDDEDTRE